MSAPPRFDHGACRDEDPELFFPIRDEDPHPYALEVCGRCPVRDACLDWAISTGQPHGVWGGLTPRHRSRLAPSGT